ncbi:class I tRNA ligase family protein [Patescibacteria group bacterium]|nr:class I tRNA ligase family protein [Patescibacteria group bacterium]MBU2260096.1 class I tRNA ligase family protein [Patescibacteria group bacterium]
MFDPVSPKQSLPDLEEGILQYWKEEDIFKRSIKQRQEAENFSFYDGPPFATGLPHYGHLLAGTIKDVIPRYQTMRGKRVERRFGWDCHGLPVENLIEKEHNITSHKQIKKMGVKKFNELCCGSVQRFTKEWREVVERMGRWVDMDWDYRTMDPDYMESIWWVFSELHRKGLIYEGHKPMHICPRCVTPLSNFEVTQAYKDITDLSVTVKFELVDEPGTFVLAWTTTPWTLPGNLMLAVNPKVEYIKFCYNGDYLIVAKDVWGKRSEPNNVLSSLQFSGRVNEKDNYPTVPVIEDDPFKGKTLLNKKYKPLFSYFEDKYKDNAFKIIKGDFVATDEGTGIVHIAPGFGEDDYNVGNNEGLEILQHVTMNGKFVDEVTDFAGEDVRPIDDPSKTDRKVTEWLEKHGKLFAKESYKHSYPHCWRCDSPLLNYATSSWFVAVEKIKEDLLDANAKTEWVPAHLRDGRFGNWLEGARDWAISRNRFWGTPIPIWRCEETGEIEVISSRDDLMKHKPERFTKLSVIRHAESEGNLIPIYQAAEPGTDLTDRGKKQASETAAQFKDQEIKVIYCSPLARTQQTAAILAKETGAEVIVDDRLREVSFGEYEGKAVDYSDLSFVKARRAHKMETGTPESIYHFPGMETWSEVQKRIADFLNNILPKHRSEHVIVVTHADPLQNVRHFFNKIDPVKLSHQPYPKLADSHTFFWDHDTNSQLDLHKHTIDDITWDGGGEKSVDITLVRHGETDWNSKRIIQGHTDTDLNKSGEQQVKESASKLKGKKFDVIISSDLKRASKSAEILSKELNIPHEGKWTELRERKHGEWEGKKRTEVLSDDMPSMGIAYINPKGGESREQFFLRLEKAGEKILNEFKGKKILVVSHGGAIKALRCIYGDGKVERTSNAGITELKISPLMKRIPEVFDCWFESGSMPYAQPHFPFENPSNVQRPRSDVRRSTLDVPKGFPADFIAEGMDQTRGWFYTLMVLSTALFKEPAFIHCVVNGIVLAEDGKKMSKKLKNYPEPMEVVDKFGADAVRFTLMSSPAVRGEDLRFSEKMVEESMRNVLLPLWNSYSFFVTYANAAKFEPVETRRTSSHPLDVWIRSEMQDLTNRMTCELDRYDLSATCNELHETIDALTNWYIRLSRRRFAGKGNTKDGEDNEDQLDALHTLYDVLLTFSQLLAPFCPYLADAIYLNLSPQEHGSVHLTDWPEEKKLTKNEGQLLKKTRLMRLIVSLGNSVRAQKNIKVRQPLQKAIVALPPAMANVLSDEDVLIIRQEMNVKELAFADKPEELADVIVRVDARKVGPRLPDRVQEIIQAGKNGDFTVEDDGRILILDEELTPDEAEVVYLGKEGLDAAADHGVVVSVDTDVSKELKHEGLARDLIRTIQRLRKESGLSFTDQIALSVKGADDVMKKYGGLIAEETRSTLKENNGKEFSEEIGGTKMKVKFEKING